MPSSPASPLRYNPVSAASRLKRRGGGYEPLFKRGEQSEESSSGPLYNKHDELTAQFLKVSDAQDSPEAARQATRTLFEAQERRRNKYAGKQMKQSTVGGDGDMFRRTRSAPDSPISSPSEARAAYAVNKDALRPEVGDGRGKSLQRAHTVAGAARKKTTQEIYNEMAMPWLSKLAEGSPKAGQISIDSSPASPIEGFSRTQSAPSPQERAGGEQTQPNLEQSSFVRTQSAPSGYKEELSRLPSYESASSYESTESHAQLQEGAEAFSRAESAPAAGEFRQDPRNAEAGSAKTPRSARSIGKSPRTARLPLQSAEEAAEALMRKGLTAEWIDESVMPFCVAEQLANRCNWDEAFADQFPCKPPPNGMFTPKRIQADFAEFLRRRDVMVVSIPVN